MFSFVWVSTTWLWSWDFVNCWERACVLLLSKNWKRWVVSCLCCRCISLMLNHCFDHHQTIAKVWNWLVWITLRIGLPILILSCDYRFRWHWSHSFSFFALWSTLSGKRKVGRFYFWSGRSIHKWTCSFSHLKSSRERSSCWRSWNGMLIANSGAMIEPWNTW